MFGVNLKKIRTKKKVSQMELANSVSVTQQAVAKWEKDAASPDPDMLIKIADYFSVSVDELLGRDVLLTKDELPPALHDMELGIILKNAKNNGMTNADIKRALEADQILKSVYGKDDNSDRGKDNT